MTGVRGTGLRRVVLALAALATALGLVNLHSAALATSGEVSPLFAAQVTHATLGVLGCAVVARVRTERLRDHSRLVWVALVALLVIVDAYGVVAGGARSWLAVGPVRIQPAELAKVALPIVLAGELCRPGATTQLRRWATIAVLGAIPIGLIAIQPDLGSAGLVAIGALSFAWFAGLPRLVWGSAAVAGVAVAPLAWAGLQPYQRARVFTFLDPTRDPSGDGYQPLQSLYAMAAGGWTGAGYEAGTQGRLGFLPEHTTDFILSALTEEWGVIGALTCLAVLFALVLAGLSVADRSRDRFTSLVAATLSVQIGWQVIVNVGGVTGLLPLTGVTLPFFSYGGSSLLSVWLTVGLLAAAARSPARLHVLSPASRGAPEPSPAAVPPRGRPAGGLVPARNGLAPEPR